MAGTQRSSLRYLPPMEIIDNINRLLGDNLRQSIAPGAKLRVAASCFSIYAFEALKSELESIDSLQFIFTTPTFIPADVTDKLRKERREFHIPKRQRETRVLRNRVRTSTQETGLTSAQSRGNAPIGYAARPFFDPTAEPLLCSSLPASAMARS